ncbi:MAG: EAL domain-containing protein [Betaproteobacteria bacterium]|nr:EAL domain-containing protein [Betaproteobacteria bacterium]
METTTYGELEARLRAALDTLPYPFYLARGDEPPRIQWINRCAAETFGAPSKGPELARFLSERLHADGAVQGTPQGDRPERPCRREYRFRQDGGGDLAVSDELCWRTTDKEGLSIGKWSIDSPAASLAGWGHPEIRVEQILDAISAPVFYKDDGGRYLGCNKAFEHFLRLPREQITGKTVYDIAPKELADVYHRADLALCRDGGVQTYESSVLDAHGLRRSVIFHKGTFLHADGRLGGLVGVILDISERKRIEEQFRLAASALENMAEGVLVTDANLRIVFVNKAFARITGFASEDVAGTLPHFLTSGSHPRRFYKKMWRALKACGHWQGEIQDQRKGGQTYPGLLSVSAVLDAARRPTHFVAVFNDISTQKQYEARLEFLAHHDTLTGLHNRSHFQQRLEEAIARTQRSGRELAVLFIDLDGFKTVNDSLGHPVGDLLLRAIAQRIKGSVRESDLVARFGGDEFAVLLDGHPDAQGPSVVAQKLIDALRTPILIAGQELYVTASIGISCYPRDGHSMAALIKHADVAMYRAKARGKNGYHVFSADLNVRAFETLRLASHLHRALERQELVVAYQPQVDLATGGLIGIEALVRWRHPEIGLIAPDKFIPLAEQTGMILPIGEWVLETACRDAGALGISGDMHLHVAVNLSARQLLQHDLASRIERILARATFDPARLELEITESMVIQDPEAARKTLGELKEIGVSLAMDDFGTGFSSLSHLRRFPIDCLKIDRCFITGVSHNPDDGAIVRAIIAMTKSLKLRTVAEGIETPEQETFLARAGCEAGQGFFLAAPMGIGQLARWMPDRGCPAGPSA